MSFELDAPDFAGANKHRLDGVVVTAMGRNAGSVLCVGWQGKSDEDGESAGHGVPKNTKSKNATDETTVIAIMQEISVNISVARHPLNRIIRPDIGILISRNVIHQLQCV